SVIAHHPFLEWKPCTRPHLRSKSHSIGSQSSTLNCWVYGSHLGWMRVKQRLSSSPREPTMKASEQFTDDLQRVLVDLIELHIQGKQAHWNVVGKNFRDLHLQLDEIIAAVREFADTIAERMRALYAVPDGTSSKVAESTSLPEYPKREVDTSETVDLVTERL